MKKILAIILSLVMMAMVFTGCSKTDAPVDDNKPVDVGQKTEDNYDFHVPFEISKNLQKQIIDNNGTENLELDSLTGATSTRTIMIELVDEALNTAK